MDLLKVKNYFINVKVKSAIIITRWTQTIFYNGSGIVVIDNAPYHSTQSVKAPTSAALKADMQNWLREHNIPFNDKMTKRELYPIILRTKPPKKYVVDDLMREQGQEVVRLPPYHCDLNPIEYIMELSKAKGGR